MDDLLIYSINTYKLIDFDKFLKFSLELAECKSRTKTRLIRILCMKQSHG
jgi:hypothetical protein